MNVYSEPNLPWSALTRTKQIARGERIRGLRSLPISACRPPLSVVAISSSYKLKSILAFELRPWTAACIARLPPGAALRCPSTRGTTAERVRGECRNCHDRGTLPTSNTQRVRKASQQRAPRTAPRRHFPPGGAKLARQSDSHRWKKPPQQPVWLSHSRVCAQSLRFPKSKALQERQHFQLQQESAPITERAYRNLKSEQGSASCNRRQRGHIRRRPMLRGEHQVSQPKSRTQPTATSSYGLSEIGLATGTCAATQRAN